MKVSATFSHGYPLRSGMLRLTLEDDITFQTGSISAFNWARWTLDFSGVTDTKYGAPSESLFIYTDSVQTSYGSYHQWYGYPLRCLSTAVEGEGNASKKRAKPRAMRTGTPSLHLSIPQHTKSFNGYFLSFNISSFLLIIHKFRNVRIS